MKRACLLLAALAAFAAPICTLAASASASSAKPSINLKAPSSLPAKVNYHVTVSGQALSSGATFVGVVAVWNVAGCPATEYGAVISPDNFMFHFHNGQGIGAKVSGSYHVNTASEKWEGSVPQKVYLCGYMYGAHEKNDKPPKATAQRVIKFK